MSAITGTIDGSKVLFDKGEMLAAWKEALTPPLPLPAPETPVAHQEAAFSGWIPSMRETQDTAIGAIYAVAAAKGVGKLLPIVSHPVLADLVARGVLGKFGHKLPGMSSEAMHAAKIVLLADALRALFPVVDSTISGVVAKIPSIGPTTPIAVPTFGSLGAVSAMRNTPTAQQGAPVVNVRSYSNL